MQLWASDDAGHHGTNRAGVRGCNAVYWRRCRLERLGCINLAIERAWRLARVDLERSRLCAHIATRSRHERTGSGTEGAESDRRYP
jgi:hypothetical protein